MWQESVVEERPALLDGKSRAQSPPVLIQVPKVHSRLRGRAGHQPSATYRPRPRRRRLRREVRMALSVFGLGSLIASGVILASGLPCRPLRSEVTRVAVDLWEGTFQDRNASVFGDSDPLSDGDPFAIELHPPVIVPDAVPVAFPGYLLPGDEREDSRHAGS